MWAEEGNLSVWEALVFTFLKAVALLSYFRGRSWSLTEATRTSHKQGTAATPSDPDSSGSDSSISSDSNDAVSGASSPLFQLGSSLGADQAAPASAPASAQPLVIASGDSPLDRSAWFGTGPPKVVVVVPVFMSQPAHIAMLRRLLDRVIHHQTRRPDQLVLVDDGSPMSVKASVRAQQDGAAGRIKVIALAANTGSANARNVGLEYAMTTFGADLICFTDTDCLPDEDWVEAAVEQLTSPAYRKRPAILSGCTRSFTDTWIDAFHNYYGTHNGRRIAPQRALLLYGCTCNMAVDRRVLSLLTFDAEFSRCSYEDIDFCMRAHGMAIPTMYCGSMRVAHDYQFRKWNPVGNVLAFARQFYRYGTGELTMVERHPSFLAWFITSHIVPSLTPVSATNCN